MPETPGLGVVLDRDRLAETHALYLEHGLGACDDAMAMQYLVPDWSFDPTRPCLVRRSVRRLARWGLLTTSMVE